MIDVNLACEDANSKLVDVVTVTVTVTVADEDRVGNHFVADFKAEVWSKSCTFVHTLSTRVGQDFEVEVQARFASGVWPIFFSADVL